MSFQSMFSSSLASAPWVGCDLGETGVTGMSSLPQGLPPVAIAVLPNARTARLGAVRLQKDLVARLSPHVGARHDSDALDGDGGIAGRMFLIAGIHSGRRTGHGVGGRVAGGDDVIVAITKGRACIRMGHVSRKSGSGEDEKGCVKK
ncbi:hypothetical protein [Rhodophyticola porphyridii]|uniref:hypothetical protein n=1 Tax=Rhodophyticola porphyridii TaxID=1852017 RepID=UPI001314481F|nr:hypothetical protein [Rhodophyticola porphyridii]